MTSRTYRAGSFLDAARKMGVEVVVGSEVEHVLAGQNPGGHLSLDFQDMEGATDRILDFARERPLQAVISPDDDGLVLAAMASDALGLSSSAVSAVQAARNKYRMRQVLADAGMPSPWFLRMDVNQDPAERLDEVSFPCVLKPLALSGSRGVIRADTPSEFRHAFDQIKTILAEPDAGLQSGALGRHILAEGYIPGEEVALEGLMIDGRLKTLAIFDKPDPLIGPYFEETIYTTPSRHPLRLLEEVRSAAASAAAGLGITQGPVHAEMRFNERGVFAVEIAPRSIGGYCSKALRFQGGVSLEELVLRQALSQDLAGAKRESQASGVMMIPTPSAGQLVQVTGRKEAREVAGVDEIMITIPPGALLRSPPFGVEYLGFIFGRAATPAEVEAALREAHARLHFEIKVESSREID
ncbi:MAG: ATP-grasp domain-containing protein [Anaerolineales bacterium]|nr:ATP-grasp domain-containing protein [Anaerolineales bacterium]